MFLDNFSLRKSKKTLDFQMILGADDQSEL